MIYAKGLRIWTDRGWKLVPDLSIGDQIISYNPARNCTEYDELAGIELGWNLRGAMSIQTKGMYQWLTPDHPILLHNMQTKITRREPIESIFMHPFAQKERVLYNRWFEPYQSTADLEEVKRIARIFSTYAKYARFDLDVQPMWQVIQNCGGHEARIFLDTFFHWNLMLFYSRWNATIELRNEELADMLFQIIARAGLGGFWAPYIFKKHIWAISISNSDDLCVNSKAGWKLNTMDGPVFNVATRNGNILVRQRSGNFIVACEYK